YKLRTMVPDAEKRLAGLHGINEHTDGPLFKASPDPRVTRIGGLLRASGIDELPQLVNVITGTMSLIGPRPALAAEVAQFDDELRERASVRPGITGLWQVEAGDLPEFAPYRRLDLYYVENWSVGLDLSILFATAWLVALRSARAVPATLHRRAVGETIVLD
ncbi:MAG TPA: sugar transferase, partial [Egibacteraceae bacterium]|nr:sugar transferase [Egibacteraceae bacterium]